MNHRNAVGWTGGQFSLIRGAAGALLLLRLAGELAGLLSRWNSGGSSAAGSETGLAAGTTADLALLLPWLVALLFALLLASGLALTLAAGIASRWSALALAVLMIVRGQGLPRPADLPWLLLLIALALVPPAPFGSWTARDRTDPRGSWAFPARLHGGLWAVLALGAAAATYGLVWGDPRATFWTCLAPAATAAQQGSSRPTALALATVLAAAAILALPTRGRPVAWGLLLALTLGGLVAGPSLWAGLGFLLLLLLAADPRWFPAERRDDLVFYDGSCGLCHRSVRFLLAEEVATDAEARLRFAPLGGETFEARIPPAERAALPDSLAVLTAEGALLTEGRAVPRLLRHLGGFWGLAGSALGWLPVGVVNFFYRQVAARRYRLFRRPKEVCPLLSPDLRQRMLS